MGILKNLQRCVRFFYFIKTLIHIRITLDIRKQDKNNHQKTCVLK